MQAMNSHKFVHAEQDYLVVGLGLSGYSAARYLLSHGYRCRVQDDRAHPPYLEALRDEYPLVEILLEPLSEALLMTAECLVVSPGVSIRNPLLRDAATAGLRVIGDIELFAEAVTKPVIGITGSNGKSTVTTLVGDMLQADGMSVGVGGNLGVPALDLLQQEADFYVLELSSFQLETTSSLRLRAATILNLSEDHMDRYDDLEDYRLSKHRIYRNAEIVISNLDDPATHHDENDQGFSLQESADFSLVDGGIASLAVQGEPWIGVDELRVRGRHNWANCLVAMGLARAVGVSRQAIVSALRSFKGLAHRSQWVAEIDGVVWINDSKATNPGATEAAIRGLDARVILLAGGQGKDADMHSLCEVLRERVARVFLFGEDAAVMAHAFAGCCEIHRVETLQQAVVEASRVARPGQAVMLSPACASFDQFSGFAERGECFIQAVEALQ